MEHSIKSQLKVDFWAKGKFDPLQTNQNQATQKVECYSDYTTVVDPLNFSDGGPGKSFDWIALFETY